MYTLNSLSGWKGLKKFIPEILLIPLYIFYSPWFLYIVVECRFQMSTGNQVQRLNCCRHSRLSSYPCCEDIRVRKLELVASVQFRYSINSSRKLENKPIALLYIFLYLKFRNIVWIKKYENFLYQQNVFGLYQSFYSNQRDQKLWIKMNVIVENFLFVLDKFLLNQLIWFMLNHEWAKAFYRKIILTELGTLVLWINLICIWYLQCWPSN